MKSCYSTFEQEPKLSYRGLLGSSVALNYVELVTYHRGNEYLSSPLAVAFAGAAHGAVPRVKLSGCE